MKCEKCGEELPEFAKFCLFCGTPVDGGAEDGPQAAPEPDSEPMTDTPVDEPGEKDLEPEIASPAASADEVEDAATTEAEDAVVDDGAAAVEAETATEDDGAAAVDDAADADADADADSDADAADVDSDDVAEPEDEGATEEGPEDEGADAAPEDEDAADPTPDAGATAPADPDRTVAADPSIFQETIPTPKKLEEPLEPMGLGAVPLVPVAPPPRAMRIKPRAPRPYVPRDAHPGVTSATASYLSRPAAPAPAPAADQPQTQPQAQDQASAKPQAPAHARPQQDPDLMGLEAVAEDADARARANEGKNPVEKGLSSAVSHASDLAGSARDRLTSVSPNKSKIIVAVVLIAAAAVLVFLVGKFATSWLGPFAPPAEEAPQVQPPSDGSIAPITPDEEEEPEEEGLPEGAPEVREAVEDYSWEELSQISALISDADSDDAGIEIAATYHLCAADGSLDGTQTKDVELSDGSVATMRIAGFRQDTKTDGGAAGISFIAENAVTEQPMGMNGQTGVGWQDTSLRAWMNEDLLAMLPEDLSGAIVAVNKYTNPTAGLGMTEQVVTSDKLWLPSYSELVGEIGAGNRRYGAYSSEGEQYQLFADLGVNWAEGGEKVALSGVYWWMRSPEVTNSSWFMCVAPDGITSYDVRPATVNAILISFCI